MARAFGPLEKPISFKGLPFGRGGMFGALVLGKENEPCQI